MAIQESLTPYVEGGGGYDYELDETGDIKLVSGSDEVALLLTQRLQTFKGEWAFDLTAGLQFSEIFTRPALQSRIDPLIKAHILGTQGVKDLVSYTSSIDKKTRNMEVKFEYRDIYTDETNNLTVSVP